MNDSVMTELRVVVERAVRPVRASNRHKRRMREELLGHLVEIYEEEAGRHDNEQAALEHARQRFGDPKELTEELWRNVPKRDRVGWALDITDYRQGDSLLHLATRHVLSMYAVITVALLGALPVWWIYGRQDEIGSFFNAMLVMPIGVAAYTLVFVVFSERIGRASFGRESDRSMRAAGFYCVASLFVLPTTGLFFDWTATGHLHLPPSLSDISSACVLAPAMPVLLLLRGRQVAREIREEEEWASLEIDE